MFERPKGKNALGNYEYRFRSRYVGALYAAGFLFAFLFLEFFWKDHPSNYSIHIAWWSIWGSLITLFFWVGKLIATWLQPVIVHEEGLETHFLKKGFDPWPQKNISFLKWAELDNVEFFQWPDRDAQKMVKRSGIRFTIGEKRMVVWEHLQGYEDFLREVESLLQKNMKDIHLARPIPRW